MEAPGCHILKTVEKLSDSLIVWFRNESGNFTDDVFNENVSHISFATTSDAQCDFRLSHCIVPLSND